jgi:hypothetical protein
MLPATHPHQRTDRTLTAGSRTCHHVPPCPPATAPGRHAARTFPERRRSMIRMLRWVQMPSARSSNATRSLWRLGTSVAMS